MERHQLSDMSVFVEVARAGGFRAAAKKLKLAPASVSEAVQRFEDRLGVRLLERTTRKISLTAVGEKLYSESLPALTDLESAIRGVGDNKDEVSGTLKLSAPRSCGTLFLNKLIARYVAAYPEVDVELIYEDQKVDLVSSGIDAAVRSHALLEQDTHAVPVGPALDMAVVAAPAYFERMGKPKTPDDLIEHDGICFAFARDGRLAPWSFEGKEGVYSVMPNPKAAVNDFDAMLGLAEAGLGITYCYAAVAAPLIKVKKLIPILEGTTPALHRYTINYLTKRLMPARLRAFIDLAKT